MTFSRPNPIVNLISGTPKVQGRFGQQSYAAEITQKVYVERNRDSCPTRTRCSARHLPATTNAPIAPIVPAPCRIDSACSLSFAQKNVARLLVHLSLHRKYADDAAVRWPSNWKNPKLFAAHQSPHHVLPMRKRGPSRYTPPCTPVVGLSVGTYNSVSSLRDHPGTGPLPRN
jgi:hypothetical protein